MTWRLAKSLEQLRRELNAQFPTRSKVSDGSVGDLSHQERKSDHNPNSAGVVTAIDVTNDPASGLSGNKLSAALVKSQDWRIKYIIWNKQIISSKDWVWRPYKGINAHQHHVHISVLEGYDDQVPWDLEFDIAQVVPVSEDKPAETTTQNIAEGGGGVVTTPQAISSVPVEPTVSQPGDPAVQATTGGFKSMITSVVGWATGSGAAFIALLKDNKTLLIGALVLIAIAGLAYFIRQLVLDRDRLRIASDRTKYNVK